MNIDGLTYDQLNLLARICREFAIALDLKLKDIESKVERRTFPEGGVVYGRNQSLSAVNKGESIIPEVVAPLDRLKSMLDNQSGNTVIEKQEDGVK